MYLGLLLTYWTVRVSVLAYVVALLLLGTSRRRTAQALWTTGACLLGIHIACALHFVYAWDHTRMVAETAKQAFDLTGISWPGAAYVNYAFLLVWAADVFYWWFVGDRVYRQRSFGLTIIVHLFLAFIVINAVVVFPKTIWIRIGGAIAMVVVLVQWGVSRRHVGSVNHP